MPTIAHLTERNRQLYFLLQSVILTHQPDSLGGLTDLDVAQAVTAVGATLETASKGIIYEHSPSSAPAQRLSAAIQSALEEAKKHGATIYNGEAALVLRSIAEGAAVTGRSTGDDRATAYLDLMRRLLNIGERHPLGGPAPGTGSIILP